MQFRLRTKISANHLRGYSVTADGCGPGASPVLITEARDGPAITSAASHWYRAPDDNTANFWRAAEQAPVHAQVSCSVAVQ